MRSGRQDFNREVCLNWSVILFRHQNYYSDMLSVLSHSLVKWFQSLEHYCTIALLYIRICISYVRLNVLNPKLFKDILSLEEFFHVKVEMLLLSNLKSRRPLHALFLFKNLNFFWKLKNKSISHQNRAVEGLLKASWIPDYGKATSQLSQKNQNAQ